MNFKVSDIASLGSILGVWAHPDDEAWSMAGIMAIAVENGQKVSCITATYGDAGETADEARWPKTEIGEIRKQEMQQALSLLGVKDHYWLGYADGKLKDLDTKLAVDKIAAIIQEVQPNSIFTFGPDGITGHDDHKTISTWTRLAAKKIGSKAKIYMACEATERFSEITEDQHSKYNIYFNIDEPDHKPYCDMDLCFDLPKDILQTKLAVIKCHASQTSPMFDDPEAIQMVENLAACECFCENC